jgi:hypothetical protein
MAITYNSNYNDTHPFSDVCFQVALGTGVEEVATIPGSDTTVYQAEFGYASNSNVFVRKNSAPTVPSSGTVTTQQYSEFKPYKRYVKGGDVVHFISPDTGTTYVGVCLRQLNQG